MDGHNVDMTQPSYETRRVINLLSKEVAEHDGEQWTCLELEVLMLSTGSDADFIDVAEVLGRTVEACRQRYYTTRRDGVVLSPQQRTARSYRGWTESDGDGW